MIIGLSHLGIRVHDFERAMAFYGHLGFDCVAGPFSTEPVAILRHPSGVEINLVINAPDATAPNVLMDVPHKHAGYTHAALSVDDVDAMAGHLEAAGLALSGQMTFPTGARAIFVRDPDGNVVEFNDSHRFEDLRDM